MKLSFDCIIIGSGIAGITAGLYLRRAGINVLIIEKEMAGGQVNRCYKIDNYPGCESIEGSVLAQNMVKQVSSLGVSIRCAEVINIVDYKDYKVVELNNEQLTCKGIIIATGRQPRKLGLPNEETLTGRGISWCAVCDGFFFKNKDVAVIGAGNSAIEEAIYLSNICNSVKLIVRKNYLRADQYLQQQLLSKNNIEVLYETEVATIIGKDRLEAIETNHNQRIIIQGLFISIGYQPSCSFLNRININTEDGYILVDNQMKTNINGIYAAGDAIKKDLYQLVTAASEGAIAANSYLKDFNNGQTLKNN